MTAFTYEHFNTLRDVLKDLNSIALRYQYAIEQSTIHGETHLFSVEEVKVIDALRERTADIGLGLGDNNFVGEIRQNLSRVSEPVRVADYIKELKDFLHRLNYLNRIIYQLVNSIATHHYTDDSEVEDEEPIDWKHYSNVSKPAARALVMRIALIIITKYCLEYAKADIHSCIQIVRGAKNSDDVTTFPEPDENTAYSVLSHRENAKYQETELNVKLRWKDETGAKSDLAELIWALGKSGKIIDPNTNAPIATVVLARQFEMIFNSSINVSGLMQGRKHSFKAEDGYTFTALLAELVDGYVVK